jgi:hypothetical protein
MSYKKKIPAFKNEDEERAFWASADSTEYIDWSKARKIKLPKLNRSVKTESSRR